MDGEECCSVGLPPVECEMLNVGCEMLKKGRAEGRGLLLITLIAQFFLQPLSLTTQRQRVLNVVDC